MWAESLSRGLQTHARLGQRSPTPASVAATGTPAPLRDPRATQRHCVGRRAAPSLLAWLARPKHLRGIAARYRCHPRKRTAILTLPSSGVLPCDAAACQTR
eukprot:scaffold54322_cov74-Phaeocystis_antarctica.AAC.2